MTTVREHFEEVEASEESDCSEVCYFAEFCTWATMAGIEPSGDPFCACVPDECLDLDYEDYYCDCHMSRMAQLEAETRLRDEREKEEEKKRIKKEETQRKRCATLAKNRDKNRNRAQERRKKRAEEKLRQLAEVFKTVNEMFE